MTSFDELRGPHFTLLLFSGTTWTPASLMETARRVGALLQEESKTYLVVGDGPGSGEWEGPVLLDPGRRLHEAYGAGGEGLLCLVRPDGYLGFRGRPRDEIRLIGYLKEVFSPNNV